MAATDPAMQLARNHDRGILFGIFLASLSFDSSYVVNIPKFNDMALTTVGNPPFQRLRTPSSAGILLAASKNEVYPLLYSTGRVESACILIRIRSAGVPIKEPIPPAVREHAIF